MTATYSYGSLILHDNITTFVESIDFSWVQVNTASYKIARIEGMKKTGETVDARQIKIRLSIVTPQGTRAALEAFLDAMDLILNQRQQKLIFHEDGRYFVADCINRSTPVQYRGAAVTDLTFTAYQPYAYAATPQVQTFTPTPHGGSPWYGNVTIFNPGTVFSRPVVTVALTGPSGANTATNLVLINSTQNQLVAAQGLTLSVNQSAVFDCDPVDASGMGYTIYIPPNQTTLYDFTGIFPTLDAQTSNWQVQMAYPSGTPQFSLTWNWTPRYLG